MPDAPEMIGSYRFVEEIGRGGMGVVYLGHDDDLDRDVAIKTIEPAFAEDRERIAQFYKEARALAQLDHPHIVRIHQLLTCNGLTYIILEYVHGRSLDDLLAGGRPLGLRMSLSICTQVALAIAAAHSCGICHRDLKPANIRVRDDQCVKVLDFGLAHSNERQPRLRTRFFRRDTSHHAPRGGGTPGYMPPEQIRGEHADARADIFALGCVLYECLTGARAFRGEDVASTLARTLRDEPDWSLLPPDAPDVISRLLRSSLSKSAAERPQSMNQVVHLLQAALGQRSDTPTPISAGPGVLRGMPHYRTMFVGRAEIIQRVAEWVSRERLTSIVGPGGCGKTRLAAECVKCVSAVFSDGVYWVDLASIRDPALVPHLVSSIIGIDDQPDADPVRATLHAIAQRHLLLVFDNCEHILHAAAELADTLLRDAPALHVLTTSRERLSIAGERLVPIGGLTVPEEGEDRGSQTTEAVELFIQRAQLVNPEFDATVENFPSVVRICRRLDGLPLAIEFAATRIRAFSVKDIEAHLDHRFQLLNESQHGIPDRFRTLRAAVDWSYDLLSETEKRVLNRLSVFVGGCHPEAAHAVCGPQCGPGTGDDLDELRVLDILTALADKSLIVVSRPRAAPVRYTLLETVRDYAAERLKESGEATKTMERHLAYCATLAEEASRHYSDESQAMWLARMDTEHENILEALSRDYAGASHTEDIVRLCSGMLRYWQLHGHFRTGLAVCTRLLRGRGLPPDSLQYAKVALVAATMMLKLSDLEGACRCARTALDGARRSRDRALEARALNLLGNAKYFAQQLEEARAYHSESLAVRREIGDTDGIGASLNNLANIAQDSGRHSEARALYEQALEINRRAGNKASAAVNLHNLCLVAFQEGELGEARRLCDEALQVRESIADPFGIAESTGQSARIALKKGDLTTAKELCRRAIELRWELGDRMGICESLDVVGSIAATEGDMATAVRTLAMSDQLRAQIGAPRAGWEQHDIARAMAGWVSADGGTSDRAECAANVDHDQAIERIVRESIEWLSQARSNTGVKPTSPTI